MTLSRLPLLITFIAAMFLTACDADTSSTTEKRVKPVHLVEVQQAQIQAVRTLLTTAGSIEARRKVRLYNEISARIVSLPYYPGDRVAAGDELVKLDDSIISAELEKAVAQKRQAKSDYARLKKLKPKQLASDEQIARAKTALDVASAEEKLQRTRLHLTSIRAPFAGVITRRLFEPGDVVAMHSQILSMIDPDSLILVVKLAEQWLPYVALEDHVQIRIDALGNAVHDGKISRIYPSINPATRKGTLEISFEPQPFAAQAGQLARAEFYTRSADRLVIPAHSLHHDANGAYVYTLDDTDKARKVRVNKGLQYGDLVAVNTGLDVNSMVITKGYIGLRDGKAVKPTNSPPVAVQTSP